MAMEPAPLARRGDADVHYSASGHSVRGIEQQVGERLPQRARINRKIFARTVAYLDADSLSIKPRLVEINYRMQQPRYIGVLRPCRASRPVHCAVCNLRNTVYFFLGERKVMATRVGEGVFGFQQIEKVQ